MLQAINVQKQKQEEDKKGMYNRKAKRKAVELIERLLTIMKIINQHLNTMDQKSFVVCKNLNRPYEGNRISD